jgi:hypothetical protein
MRVAQILTPILILLATAACSRQQASYYMPATATQQPQYAQAPSASSGRGLFTSPQNAQQAYAQQASAQPQTPPGSPPEPSGRGLFNTYAANDTRYAQPAYPQPSYTPPPAAQRRYAQPAYPQQQPNYTAQPAPTAYRPASYGTGGPYTPAPVSNPYATARWY